MATKFFRSKDQQEVQELEKEGAKAISLQPDEPIRFTDENYVMVVGEERMVLQPHALEEPPVKQLITVLIRWMNDILEERRIIVRDIVEDVYDGQVLGELLAVLTKEEINYTGVTMSAYMQRNKLKRLLEAVDNMLGVRGEQKKWTVQSIHSKDAVSILHLIVALARFFRCQHALPMNVKVKRIHVKQLEHKMETRLIVEEITGDNIGPIAPAPQTERDVFDKLFEEAPDKLDAVKRSLCQFATKVLQDMDVVVNDLDTQFHNGVYLVLMMGLLEGYFVPLYQFHYNPVGYNEKLENMKLAFRLLEDAGLPQPRSKPEELVYKDLKSTLRVLYSVFGKYKSALQQPQAQPPRGRSATPTSPTSSSSTSTI